MESNQIKSEEQYGQFQPGWIDGPGRGICGTDGRFDLSSAYGTRLRSGGPRGSHVADRPDKHLGA